GCSELVSFTRQASAERTVAAGLTLVGALVLVALFGLLALTLLIAKFTLTLIFAATPFAAVAAVFPGAARRCAWVWLGALLQVFVVVVGTEIGRASWREGAGGWRRQGRASRRTR